jgi:hypothetical protein
MPRDIIFLLIFVPRLPGVGVKFLVSERIYNLSDTIILTARSGTFPDIGYNNKDRIRGGIIHNPNPAITIASIVECVRHCEHPKGAWQSFQKRRVCFVSLAMTILVAGFGYKVLRGNVWT